MKVPKIFKDIVMVQNEYEKLRSTGRLSKRAMCEIANSFRDEYSDLNLTDIQVLMIMRGQLSLKEIIKILEG